MYSIEKTSFGLRLIFAGDIDPAEMQKWLDDSVQTLSAMPPSFGVFVDMRQLELVSTGVQKAFEDGQRLYKKAGMVRSVVIVNNPTLAIQFKRIALQSDIYDWERYIDVATTPDWETVGVNWVSRGIDPDAEWREQILQRNLAGRTSD